MIIAVTIAVLVAGGVYMILQRGMVRIVFGMGLVSHATNLLILATGIGAWRSEPFAERTPLSDAADPLPQAFVLTAIAVSYTHLDVYKRQRSLLRAFMESFKSARILFCSSLITATILAGCGRTGSLGSWLDVYKRQAPMRVLDPGIEQVTLTPAK